MNFAVIEDSRSQAEVLTALLKSEGYHVDLTQREFDLAVILWRNVGRVLAREELLAAIWGHEPGVDSHIVDTLASRLLKKLGLAGESGLMLTSVYGQGYRRDTVQAG